jgi:uncharacterized protein (DUF433 family)
MAVRTGRPVATNDDDLIKRYIEPDPHRSGPAYARLKESGVHVWALVGHWQATGRETEPVAQDYELPREAVQAALAYYRRHTAAIDAHLAANAA